MRRSSVAVVFAAACAFPLVWSSRVAIGGGDVPGTARVDSVREFSLPGLDGKSHALSELRASRLVVLAWTEPGCPVAKVYAPRLASLAKDYRSKGVGFFAMASGTIDDADAKALVRSAGIEFPLLLDGDGAIAQRLGVESTTTAVVLDENRRVRYRGAVDDQYDVKGRKADASHRFLVEALEALLAGRPPPVERTPAPGCPLETRAAPSKPASVTWNHDVAAIVHRRCAACHRENDAAPFALLTYDDAKKHAATMHAAVSESRMPPWSDVGPYGRFVNDRRLLPKERETLLAWLEGGTPEGSGTPPPPPAPATVDGWEIGKPDAVVTFAKPQEVPAEGVVPYRFVEVATHFDEDRWIQSMEVRPGAPGVVHHVLVAVSDGTTRRRGEAFNPMRGFFAAMVPGGHTSVFPEGLAKRLPKGATLLFQMHYTPNGVAQSDATSIGFRFAKGKPEHEVRTTAVFNPTFRIPPGEASWQVNAFFPLPVPWDVDVLAFMPHMHLRGKSFRYSFNKPLEPEHVVFEVPKYDFNWQTPYRLAVPMRVAKGTIFKGVAVFDNSDGNPYNPDPTAEVHWGDQTWDEMMIGYVDYVLVNENDAKALPLAR